jgi:ABC-type tungstate transport system permease subunit
MQIDPPSSPCTKLKSKWIKELHIKPETLKLIEEKVGKVLEDVGTWINFLNRTAIDCALRSRIDKWDLIKFHSFCKANDTLNKIKRPPTDWESIQYIQRTEETGLQKIK